VLTALLVLASATTAAQSAQRPVLQETPLQINVVLSRHQEGKLVSSLPFTVIVGSTEQGVRASLRMGVDVPIGTTTTSSTRGTSTETTTTTTKPEYRHVGTAIDATATTLADGRFRIWINAQDSSIYNTGPEGPQSIRAADAMAFRTFTMSNTLTMAVGETKQFAVATDRVSGEMLKLDVTLSAAK
jgi:hypothetical protein